MKFKTIFAQTTDTRQQERIQAVLAINGGILGASAFNAYQNQDQNSDKPLTLYNLLVDPFSVFKSLQESNSNNAIKNQSSSSKDGGIQKDLDELKRLLFTQRQQPVYIHGNSNSGSLRLIAIPAGALGLYLLYLRIVKGWSIFDMMVVTKASLKQSVGQVTEGIEGLQSRLQKTRQYLQEQLQNLSLRQDQNIKQQQELSNDVSKIGSDVDQTRQDVAKVHFSVEDLNMQVDKMNTLSMYTTNGIFLLCNAVSDLMKSTKQITNPSYEMLGQYLKQSPPQRMQGLEGRKNSKNNQLEFKQDDEEFSTLNLPNDRNVMQKSKTFNDQRDQNQQSINKRMNSFQSKPSQGLGGILLSRDQQDQ